jgi:hypothetical protein
MMGQLKAAGYEITNNSAEAETVVVNTCGFIESAKTESVEAILEATGAKANGVTKRVIVAGCLVERYRDDLLKELPEVDAFIGTNEIGRILEAADETKNFKDLPLMQIGNKTATYLYDFDTPRLPCHRIAHGVYQNRRRLRPTVRVLLDSRNARLVSLASFRFDLERSRRFSETRCEGNCFNRAGFFPLRRRFGRERRAGETHSRTREIQIWNGFA